MTTGQGRNSTSTDMAGVGQTVQSPRDPNSILEPFPRPCAEIALPFIAQQSPGHSASYATHLIHIVALVTSSRIRYCANTQRMMQSSGPDAMLTVMVPYSNCKRKSSSPDRYPVSYLFSQLILTRAHVISALQERSCARISHQPPPACMASSGEAYHSRALVHVLLCKG